MVVLTANSMLCKICAGAFWKKPDNVRMTYMPTIWQDLVHSTDAMKLLGGMFSDKAANLLNEDIDEDFVVDSSLIM